MQKLIFKIKSKGHGAFYKAVIVGGLFRRMVLDFYHFVRSQSQSTKLLGPQYTRSRRLIEIDITYRCNLKCVSCNRSCSQAPTKEEMKVEQIEEFVKESIDKKIKWRRIRLVGGEPTLHSDFSMIIKLLLSYKEKYNSDLQITVVTNGFGNYVKEALSKLPKEIDIQNTFKSSHNPFFFPFNMAPEDSFWYKNADYSNGCWIISKCGMGLTPSGYYPCAIAGGIDRIFSFGMGGKNLPSHDDLMVDHLRIFCRLCGHFRFALPTRKRKISPRWEEAYNLYKGCGFALGSKILKKGFNP